MALRVDIKKKLGGFRLNIRFEAKDGVLALLGASGCGKSMTLKCIAGVEKPDRGRIEMDGRVLFDSEKHICLPPQERRVGYLFQQYALFPNMTVRQNIICGVREKKNKRAAADEMIARMRLEGLEDKRPGQLSGGQQQRTALARILVNAPDLLLLDEPFSALDSHLRFQMEQEVRHVIRQFGRPVLLVSHSRDEVFRLADRVAILNGGQVECIGDNHEVFANPETRNGAILTGCKNISRLKALDDGTVLALDWGISLTPPIQNRKAAYIGIRMHDVRLAEKDEKTNVVDMRVEEVIENPFSFTVMLKPEGAEAPLPVGWEMEKSVWRSVGAERLRVCLPQEALLILKA